MAETTQNETLEQQRFIANTEEQARNQDDESVLQDIAEFIMISADQVVNPNLGNELKNLSNQIVSNKTDLASTPGEDGGEAPLTPEEAIAQQGMQGQDPMQQGLPGGLPPGGGAGGIPPEVAQALASQGGGLPPV